MEVFAEDECVGSLVGLRGEQNGKGMENFRLTFDLGLASGSLLVTCVMRSRSGEVEPRRRSSRSELVRSIGSNIAEESECEWSFEQEPFCWGVWVSAMVDMV